MILPAQTIRKLCTPEQKGKKITKPMVHPFSERTPSGGLTFGLSAAGYDVRIAESVDLYAVDGGMGFQLASTIEQFCMPNDVLAVVHDKSTWARRGLAVQNTVIEPGWSGYLTLELSNHSNRLIQIPKGAPIAQVVFMRLEAPTEQPYEGRYQNQEAGPQAARYLNK